MQDSGAVLDSHLYQTEHISYVGFWEFGIAAFLCLGSSISKKAKCVMNKEAA